MQPSHRVFFLQLKDILCHTKNKRELAYKGTYVERTCFRSPVLPNCLGAKTHVANVTTE